MKIQTFRIKLPVPSVKFQQLNDLMEPGLLELKKGPKMRENSARKAQMAYFLHFSGLFHSKKAILCAEPSINSTESNLLLDSLFLETFQSQFHLGINLSRQLVSRKFSGHLGQAFRCCLAIQKYRETNQARENKGFSE